MTSSAPPPGGPGTAPRRGSAGLLGALAVLASLVLAVYLITRREPGRIVDAPPPAAPSPLPSASEGTTASPTPLPTAGASPQAGKPATPRRAGTGPGINPPAASAPRRFLLGTTSVENVRPVGDLDGFEGGSVDVKRAPEVHGRLELSMEPPQVRPGTGYKVKLFLAN